MLLGLRTSVYPPESFDGDPDRFGGFLLQCKLAFSRAPVAYNSDNAKITFLVRALKGQALRWSEAFFDSHPIEQLTYAQFLEEFKRVFDHPLRQEEAAKRILSLRQGKRSVAEHSIAFRVIAQETGWDNDALKGIFVNSLSEYFKDQLASRDDPETLDEAIKLAVRLDDRLRERQKGKKSKPHERSAPGFRSFPVPPPCPPIAHQKEEPEPMQLGRTRLSPEERQRRMQAKECIYCGKPGHFIAACPLLLKARTHQ